MRSAHVALGRKTAGGANRTVWLPPTLAGCNLASHCLPDLTRRREVRHANQDRQRLRVGAYPRALSPSRHKQKITVVPPPPTCPAKFVLVLVAVNPTRAPL